MLSEGSAKSEAPFDGRRTRVLILGAAGRDFHNFNMAYREDAGVEVVAFTATQIPGISERRYPASLAGRLYPAGIPIYEETQLEELCRRFQVEQVIFAYSDVTHEHVMHLASRVLAAGADFTLLGPDRTMLRSKRPVIAVSGVRTGCGKSQVARWLSRRLRSLGRQTAVIRHPMPYGELELERVQRFASRLDLVAARCTAEEREEYEPHVAVGNIVYAGTDYGEILRCAESEAEIIVWDGGNNDFPFVRPDLHVVVVDALRPDQIVTHHPGEAVARMADVVVVNKVNAASPRATEAITEQMGALNPRATLVRAASILQLDSPERVRGKRALVVEDAPTLTHGGMASGAGYAAAVEAGVGEIVDPRPSAPPELIALLNQYPHIGKVLPALGYNARQLGWLEETINRADADVVISGTPLDLAALVKLNKPVLRVRYEFAEVGGSVLEHALTAFLTTPSPRH